MNDRKEWLGRAALAAVVAASTLAGCAETVRSRGSGVFVGNQGGAWEVVLGGADHDVPSGAAYAPEFARGDSRLGVGAVEAEAEAAAWPYYEQLPTLEQARRLNITQSSETVIYFRRDRSRLRINQE